MRSSDVVSIHEALAHKGDSSPKKADAVQPDEDLAGALHEVSNALTVVLGWLDVAHSKLKPGEERDAVEVARTHARLGHRVARQAIGADTFAGGTSERAARSLASCAVVGVTPQAQQRNVSIELHAHNNGLALVPNVGAALQILTNLLLNAVEFTPPGETIRLEIQETGNSVIFTVADKGPGIPDDRRDSLFDAPMSTRRGGAGIGLRHSAALAEAKGGKLRLGRPQADHDGSGACFELWWPIAEARSSARPAKGPKKRSDLSGARVLVVEDDAAVRSLIELALEARGVEAVVVASEQEFERVVERGPAFDAALVDLSPIQAKVEDSLKALHASSPGVITLLISGVASGVPDGVGHYFAAWVRKPFEMGEVIQSLSRELERRRQ